MGILMVDVWIKYIFKVSMTVTKKKLLVLALSLITLSSFHPTKSYVKFENRFKFLKKYSMFYF